MGKKLLICLATGIATIFFGLSAYSFEKISNVSILESENLKEKIEPLNFTKQSENSKFKSKFKDLFKEVEETNKTSETSNEIFISKAKFGKNEAYIAILSGPIYCGMKSCTTYAFLKNKNDKNFKRIDLPGLNLAGIAYSLHCSNQNYIIHGNGNEWFQTSLAQPAEVVSRSKDIQSLSGCSLTK